jgi:hypothetical protein
VTPTNIKFVDIAGLVQGAHKGHGLGNLFLSHIRDVDVIVQVVRCFESSKIPFFADTLNPRRDIEIINLELILKDLEVVQRREDRIRTRLRLGRDKGSENELQFLTRLKNGLNKGVLARNITFDFDPDPFLQECDLLTSKPMIYVANIKGEDKEKERVLVQELELRAKDDRASALCVNIGMEEDLSKLSKNEEVLYRQELGIEEGSLAKLIRTGYEILDLITFFTVERGKVRAWTLKKGSICIEAAAKIHTDMAKGFICAEVANFKKLSSSGSLSACKAQGLVDIEGRDYKIKDGDVITIKFRA